MLFRFLRLKHPTGSSFEWLIEISSLIDSQKIGESIVDFDRGL